MTFKTFLQMSDQSQPKSLMQKRTYEKKKNRNYNANTCRDYNNIYSIKK